MKPRIRYMNSVKMWRCRCKDKINGIGITAKDAFKDWQAHKLFSEVFRSNP